MKTLLMAGCAALLAAAPAFACDRSDAGPDLGARFAAAPKQFDGDKPNEAGMDGDAMSGGMSGDAGKPDESGGMAGGGSDAAPPMASADDGKPNDAANPQVAEAAPPVAAVTAQPQRRNRRSSLGTAAALLGALAAAENGGDAAPASGDAGAPKAR